MNRVILVMLMVCVSSTVSIFPQEFFEETRDAIEETNEAAGEAGNIKLKLDFPLFDFPYQIDTMNTAGYGFFGSYGSMSMGQSLALTLDLYSSMHFGISARF